MTVRQWMRVQSEIIRVKFLLMSFEFQDRRLIKELAEKAGVKIEDEALKLLSSGGTAFLGHFNKRSTGPRRWFERIITFFPWLFFSCLERIITFLYRLFFQGGQGKKMGMLIFCKDFDKCVENVRNKRPINGPGVYTTIARMETEMHGGSEFWKFPALGEQSHKEDMEAQGFTLIGALLMSDQVWLRVIDDDFEFDVARQICEQATFGYLNVKRKVDT